MCKFPSCKLFGKFINWESFQESHAWRKRFAIQDFPHQEFQQKIKNIYNLCGTSPENSKSNRRFFQSSRNQLSNPSQSWNRHQKLPFSPHQSSPRTKAPSPKALMKTKSNMSPTGRLRARWTRRTPRLKALRAASKYRPTKPSSRAGNEHS